jgi:hypothetical protein
MRRTIHWKRSEGNGRSGRISDEAVRAKTGRVWKQWFSILDAAGAAKMAHGDIARLLAKRYPAIGGWWQQMVTVTYEQARGLRARHQRPEGYAVSGSRTISASAGALYRAFSDPGTRRRWLRESRLTVRQATPRKSVRLTWADGKTIVEVNFYPQGPDRCQVVVDHRKLGDARAAARMKRYWARSLDSLRRGMET